MGTPAAFKLSPVASAMPSRLTTKAANPISVLRAPRPLVSGQRPGQRVEVSAAIEAERAGGHRGREAMHCPGGGQRGHRCRPGRPPPRIGGGKAKLSLYGSPGISIPNNCRNRPR